MSLQGIYYYLHFTDIKTKAKEVILPAQGHIAYSPRVFPNMVSSHTLASLMQPPQYFTEKMMS